MTPPPFDSDPESVLNAREIIQASAALTLHFERLGVQFGPAPVATGVQQWAEQFLAESTAVSTQGAVSTLGAVPLLSPVEELPPSKSQPLRRVDSVAKAIEPARPKPPAPPQSPTNPVVASGSVAAVSGSTGAYSGPSLPVAQRTHRLSELERMVAGCTRCEVLTKCRTHTVFGEGSATPRIVFFGEAPGADEDRLGRPFVGLAGQLLNKMIQACTLAREDVYILNTVKCRPPGNRNPEPIELRSCREFFVSQLEVLRPEYIVCLGLISSQSLLSSTLSIGLLRGKFHQYFGSKVVVTYHPAYLLRNPDAKKAAWDDLQMMLRDMGITPRR